MTETLERPKGGPTLDAERLSAEQRRSLDRIIDKEGAQSSALIPILHATQQAFGYLAPAAQDHIAARLRLPATAVHGVVTFYSFFKTRPSGRHKANVCLGTACYVRGSARIISDLEEHLGIRAGETTKDGQVTLGACRCIGLCDKAPAIIVDDDEVHGPIDTKEAKEILERMD